MRIQDDIQLDYCDVLLRPKRSALSSRSEVDVLRQYTFRWCPRVLQGTGIISANMFTTGTMQIAREMQKQHLFTALHKHYAAEELLAFLKDNAKLFGSNELIFVSSGVSETDYEKLKTVMASGLVHNICIDVANGYSPYLVNYVQKVRKTWPECLIMAGNVVTGDMTEDLILSGADIVKVGIGPGSVCTTRKLTGVGRPQFSTVIECADAAHGVGGMLAGHEESAGELCVKHFQTDEVEMIDDKTCALHMEEKQFKKFYGMSSEYAQQAHYGGMKKYRASEGKVVEIPFRGPIEPTLLALLGGLRSCMTYIGAKRLKDMPKCATFYRVNRQLNNIFGEERN